MARLYSLLALLSLFQPMFATIITLYTDESCTIPYAQYSGPNNGVCQSFIFNASSYKITNLDSDCGITVYGPDASDCSSDTKHVAAFESCYGYSSTAWLFQYSIDDCTSTSDVSSSSLLASVPTSRTTTSQSTATFVTQSTSTKQTSSLLTSTLSSVTTTSQSSDHVTQTNSMTQVSTSPTISPTSTPTSTPTTQSGNGGNGLSTTSQIVIGVVIPVIAILVAIGIGVWQKCF